MQATQRGPSGSTDLGPAILEFSRFTSPRLLLLATVLAWAARLARPSWTWADALVAMAILAFWPLQEWLIHVYLLHARPQRVGRFTFDLLVAREHRKHHRDPWNLPLVFIPTPVFLLAFPALYFGWYAIVPREVAATGLALTLTLALHYEWGHYMAHSSYQPKLAYYRRMVRHHRLHHFKNEHYWFGVSILGGDWLMHTDPEPRDVEISRTARSLSEPAAQRPDKLDLQSPPPLLEGAQGETPTHG